MYHQAGYADVMLEMYFQHNPRNSIIGAKLIKDVFDCKVRNLSWLQFKRRQLVILQLRARRFLRCRSGRSLLSRRSHALRQHGEGIVEEMYL